MGKFKKEDLTQKHLKELLDYDCETGLFTRKIKTSYKTTIDEVVGHFDGSGYLVCKIHSSNFKLHQLVFLYQTGEWPCGEVDHINGNKTDNSFKNLRVVSKEVNQQNRILEKSTSKSGYVGVVWDKRSNKWLARITANKVVYFLGYFTDLIQAANAYAIAKTIYHKEAIRNK